MIIASHRVFKIADIPKKNTLLEIAVVGRSNVGKSTLLNTLLNHKIARVSKTPGCTYWIGIYILSDVTLVDLPGYGYAKVHKDRLQRMYDLKQRYFDLHRLNELWILIDSRRGVSDQDQILINNMIRYEIPYKIIATKCDKKGENKVDKYDFEVSKRNVQDLSSYLSSISCDIVFNQNKIIKMRDKQ